MKFKFRLETVLKNRKVAKDVAERDYREADRQLVEQLGRIKAMYEDIDQTRSEIEATQSRGGNTAQNLQMLNEFIEGQKIRIERGRQKARELMQVREEKHEILVEKNKDFKALEKFKEKQKLEAKIKNKKRTTKLIDDLTSTRFAMEKK